jgi:hypothetical protein
VPLFGKRGAWRARSSAVTIPVSGLGAFAIQGAIPSRCAAQDRPPMAERSMIVESEVDLHAARRQYPLQQNLALSMS